MRQAKIILAPDSFKESLDASRVAAAMACGVARVSASIMTHERPVGDGGEGTMDTLVTSLGGRRFREHVVGPLGDLVDARYAVLDNNTAVIELAEACGLARVPSALRDPMRTTTFGAGQLIRRALDRDPIDLLVCIGGSATVDGGTALAQALGWEFVDRKGNTIHEHLCGGLLLRIAHIRPPQFELPAVRVACDVTNPLCGTAGAAIVYGPQKGATTQQALALDAGLVHLANVAGGNPDQPGAGAAGGAGYGLATFLNATLLRGIDAVLDALGFRNLCRDADLVVTGEGRLDAQSLHGKACMGVAKVARELGVPTIAVVGSTGPGAEDCLESRGGHLRDYVSLADRFGRERALKEPAAAIAEATERLVRAAVFRSH